MTLRYWPRRPKFPVIVDLGRQLVGARSASECSKQLARALLERTTSHWAVIDASAEGFAYYPEHSIISPLAWKKRWTKSEVVELYRSRRRPDAPEYNPGSLSNKRFERVVAEIVELLNDR